MAAHRIGPDLSRTRRLDGREIMVSNVIVPYDDTLEAARLTRRAISQVRPLSRGPSLPLLGRASSHLSVATAPRRCRRQWP